MAGRGRIPKDADQRHNPRDKPIHEWKAAPGIGWQHGELPNPPTGLLKSSREVWHTWLTAWFAAHWRPEDLPGLYHLIRLYDQVTRGEGSRSSELRLTMDTYGVTPKGQQDRRWRPPEAEKTAEPRAARGTAYGHLRAIESAESA